MGKAAGKKQKTKPKDKKQSDRLKQTARDIGADQETEDALKVLDRMIGRHVSEPTGKATTFVSINSGGVVTLADGTYWRVASEGLVRVPHWRVGAPVMVDRINHPLWPLSLVNLENQERTGVQPSRKPV
jgi:hypothetical protein